MSLVPKWQALDGVNAPSTISRRRIHGSVAHQLGVMIIGGRLAPGDVLPNEDVVSANLSVSRTAYREAVRTLAAKGLVDSRPKAGTRITPARQMELPRSRRALVALRGRAEPDLHHLALRAAPDRRAGSLRASPPSDATRTTSRRSAAPSPSSANRRRARSHGLEADLAFHHAILVAARNEPLQSLSSVIGSTLRWSVRLKLTAEPRVFENSLPDHVAVIEAIADQDTAEASTRMRELITKALAETLEVLAVQTSR